MGTDQRVPGVTVGDVRVWPRGSGTLTGEWPWTRESLDDYLSAGGYASPPLGGSPPRPGDPAPAEIQRRLSAVPRLHTLRGRGGAAFPTAVKLQAVAQSAAASCKRPVVVANGAEGEPLSCKDRYLLRWRPHLVLDGLLLVAWALDASEAYVYAADAAALASMADATAELGARLDSAPPLRLVVAQETYVAGEETAVVRAITTRIARPADKPPRPFERGIRGEPTLVLNVETLASIAAAARPGQGREGDRFLATISGAGTEPVLYEVPAGMRLGDLLRDYSGRCDSSFNVLMGGFFGGIIPAWPVLQLGYDEVASRGSSLGCAALHLLSPQECPVKVAADVAAFFARNNAQQCGSCMSATTAISAALSALGHPQPGQGYEARLARWGHQLRGRGACAVPDGLATLLRSLLRNYPEVVVRHIGGGCARCRDAQQADRWEYLRMELPAGDPAAPARSDRQLTLAAER